MKMKTAAMALLMSSGMATAEMSVQLSGGWDGARVPACQQCKFHSVNGSTPPMQVSGIPQGTKWIIADFNDLSYQPLSKKRWARAYRFSCERQHGQASGGAGDDGQASCGCAGDQGGTG
ncbi:MAG: hypothetical protein WAO78_06830 [Roseovarius sp.]